MKQFYTVKNKEIKERLYEHEIIDLAYLCPPHILSSDIRKWVNGAKDGDSFQINYALTVVCIDLDRFNI